MAAAPFPCASIELPVAATVALTEYVVLAPTQGCRHGQPLPSTSRSYLQTGWPRYGIKTAQTIVLNRYHGRPMLPPQENSAASSELPRLGSPVTSRTAPLPVTAAEAAAGPARERNRLASSRARSPHCILLCSSKPEALRSHCRTGGAALLA